MQKTYAVQLLLNVSSPGGIYKPRVWTRLAHEPARFGPGEKPDPQGAEPAFHENVVPTEVEAIVYDIETVQAYAHEAGDAQCAENGGNWFAHGCLTVRGQYSNGRGVS
jgi:hypothetical protein